jgi:hypothetical protein
MFFKKLSMVLNLDLHLVSLRPPEEQREIYDRTVLSIFFDGSVVSPRQNSILRENFLHLIEQSL